MTSLARLQASAGKKLRLPGKTANRLQITGMRLMLAIIVLVSWQAVVALGWVDPFFISSPAKIGSFLVRFVGSGEIWNNLWVTLWATLLGYVIGSVSGIAAGMLLARFERLDLLLNPFLTMLNSLPRVALAPLFLLWFGLGINSKVALSISLVFFILLINTRSGIKSVDTDIVTGSRLLGGNERQLFQKVILPATVPSIAAGLQLAVIYSLLGVVVGEMIASQAGLGQRIAFYSTQFNTAGVLGVLVVLAIIASTLNGITVAAERRLLRWQDRGRL